MRDKVLAEVLVDIQVANLVEAVGALLPYLTDPDVLEDLKTDRLVRMEKELAIARVDKAYDNLRKEKSNAVKKEG